MLEAGPWNFQRQLDYWSWAEVDGCTAQYLRGDQSLFMSADETQAQLKRTHIHTLTGTCHVYTVDEGWSIFCSQPIFPLLNRIHWIKQFCINPPLNPGSPRRPLKPPPSPCSVMAATTRASRQGQFLPAETETGESESGPPWDTYCIAGYTTTPCLKIPKRWAVLWIGRCAEKTVYKQQLCVLRVKESGASEAPEGD